MAKVLLIDDDADVIAQYRAALAGTEHEVVTAGSAKAAREALKLGSFDVAVVDIMMDEGIPGFDLAREIRKQAPKAAILMVSSLNAELKSPMDTRPDEKLTITKYLDKPLTGKKLVEEIRAALEKCKTPQKA